MTMSSMTFRTNSHSSFDFVIPALILTFFVFNRYELYTLGYNNNSNNNNNIIQLVFNLSY